MAIYATRQEIRNRVLSRLGFTTNGSQSPETEAKVNEDIRAASLMLANLYKHQYAMMESRVTVGIDQRFVNYPTDCRIGGILSIGVWIEEEGKYRPLKKRPINVSYDDEPTVETGEPGSISGRGTPCIFEQKRQIEIWPRPDKQYELKFDYQASPELIADEQESQFDAECIVLWAMAEYYDHQGDERLANKKRDQCIQMANMIHANEFPLETIQRGKYDRLSVLPRRTHDFIPNSGSWPSVAGGG